MANGNGRKNGRVDQSSPEFKARLAAEQVRTKERAAGRTNGAASRALSGGKASAETVKPQRKNGNGNGNGTTPTGGMTSAEAARRKRISEREERGLPPGE